MWAVSLSLLEIHGSKPLLWAGSVTHYKLQSIYNHLGDAVAWIQLSDRQRISRVFAQIHMVLQDAVNDASNSLFS